MQAIWDNIGWIDGNADLNAKCLPYLSSLFPHLRPQIHKILPFLDIAFEVKSKENTIQNLLAVAKWLSVLLFQYK